MEDGFHSNCNAIFSEHDVIFQSLSKAARLHSMGASRQHLIYRLKQLQHAYVMDIVNCLIVELASLHHLVFQDCFHQQAKVGCRFEILSPS